MAEISEMKLSDVQGTLLSRDNPSPREKMGKQVGAEPPPKPFKPQQRLGLGASSNSCLPPMHCQTQGHMVGSAKRDLDLQTACGRKRESA